MGLQIFGFFWIVLFFIVFRPETANSEARFGILVKNQPRGWILSQIGANWTGFVAFFDLDRGTTVAAMVGTLSMGSEIPPILLPSPLPPRGL